MDLRQKLWKRAGNLSDKKKKNLENFREYRNQKRSQAYDFRRDDDLINNCLPVTPGKT